MPPIDSDTHDLLQKLRTAFSAHRACPTTQTLTKLLECLRACEEHAVHGKVSPYEYGLLMTEITLILVEIH